MTGGGLFDPLGADRAEPTRPGSALSVPVVVVGLVLLGVATLIAVAWLRDDGDRGEPRAVSPIEHVAAPPKPPAPPPVPPSTGAASGVTSAGDDQEVEIQNGVRIIRPRRVPPSSTSQTLHVPDASH